GPEHRLALTFESESALFVEQPRRWVCRHGQRQSLNSRFVRSGFDEGRTDALAPKVRFDKQPVELAGNHRSKARDSSLKLGDQHLAFRDLLGRNFDDLGMGLELFAIF